VRLSFPDGLPWIKTWSFSRQLSSALEWLHERNFVHRDVKPQNVFLKTSTTIKLGDFGFAVQVSASSPLIVVANEERCDSWSTPTSHLETDPETNIALFRQPREGSAASSQQETKHEKEEVESKARRRKEEEEEEEVKGRARGAGGRRKKKRTGERIDLGMVGTPNYLAPEIVRRRPYNTQVDVWSLGVCVYFMATGQAPFSARSKRATFARIIRQQYSVPNKVPGVLRRVIEAALLVDPEQRASARQLREALQEPFPPEQQQRDPPPPLPPPLQPFSSSPHTT